MLFSYVLFQAHRIMVKTFEKINFYVVDYNKLPIEVKERMPQIEGSICMKFLLPKWRKNRFDLIRKPVGYLPSTYGSILRSKLDNVHNTYGRIILDKYVFDKQ